MDTLVWLTFVGVGVMIGLGFHLSRQLHQVATRPPRSEHDELIEKQVSREVEGYIKVRERVEAEKRQLPEIDPYRIDTINNWEEDLIARAEKLRNLIVEAHGDRDTYYIDQDAQKVPMDYYLAHDLVTVAHLKKGISGLRRLSG
jgi:sugar-specific transcriptional regulator TrmB